MSLRPLAALGQGATADARPKGLAVLWTHLPPHLPAGRQRGPGSVLSCPPLPECPGAVGLSSPQNQVGAGAPGGRRPPPGSGSPQWHVWPWGGQPPLRAGALRGPSGAASALGRLRVSGLWPGTCPPARIFANPTQLQLDRTTLQNGFYCLAVWMLYHSTAPLVRWPVLGFGNRTSHLKSVLVGHFCIGPWRSG